MSSAPLRAESVTLAYDARVVAEGLTVAIPEGGFTAIVGPNACGKSTLLRALVRMLKPKAGSVLLDGVEISSLPTKQVARRLGLLPQSSIAPDGITVVDLVARGRHPYQRLLRQWSREDERAVAEAMAQTHIEELSGRLVDELSGGQRQRVWIAMALAQETPLLLLDEPITFLDIAHQVEVLDLCAKLHERGADARRRAARPQSRLPLRDAPDRDARRRDRRRGAARGDRDRFAGRGGLRVEVPGRAVPRDRRADGRSRRAAVTGRELLRGVLRAHRWRVLLAAVLLGAHQGFEALVPVVVGAAIDDAVAPGDGSALLLWVGVLAVLFVFLSTAYREGARAEERVTETAAHELRMRLVRRVVDPRGGGEAGLMPGQLLSVATADVQAAANVIAGIAYGTGVVVALVAGTIVLLLTSLTLGVTVLLGLPLIVWAGGRLGALLSAPGGRPAGRGRGRKRCRRGPRHGPARAAGDRRRRHGRGALPRRPASPPCGRRWPRRERRSRWARPPCSSAAWPSRASRSSAGAWRSRARSRSAS